MFRMPDKPGLGYQSQVQSRNKSGIPSLFDLIADANAGKFQGVKAGQSGSKPEKCSGRISDTDLDLAHSQGLDVFFSSSTKSDPKGPVTPAVLSVQTHDVKGSKARRWEEIRKKYSLESSTDDGENSNQQSSVLVPSPGDRFSTQKQGSSAIPPEASVPRRMSSPMKPGLNIGGNSTQGKFPASRGKLQSRSSISNMREEHSGGSNLPYQTTPANQPSERPKGILKQPSNLKNLDNIDSSKPWQKEVSGIVSQGFGQDRSFASSRQMKETQKGRLGNSDEGHVHDFGRDMQPEVSWILQSKEQSEGDLVSSDQNYKSFMHPDISETIQNSNNNTQSRSTLISSLKKSNETAGDSNSDIKPLFPVAQKSSGSGVIGQSGSQALALFEKIRKDLGIGPISTEHRDSGSGQPKQQETSGSIDYNHDRQYPRTDSMRDSVSSEFHPGQSSVTTRYQDQQYKSSKTDPCCVNTGSKVDSSSVADFKASFSVLMRKLTESGLVRGSFVSHLSSSASVSTGQVNIQGQAVNQTSIQNEIIHQGQGQTLGQVQPVRSLSSGVRPVHSHGQIQSQSQHQGHIQGQGQTGGVSTYKNTDDYYRGFPAGKTQDTEKQWTDFFIGSDCFRGQQFPAENTLSTLTQKHGVTLSQAISEAQGKKQSRFEVEADGTIKTVPWKKDVDQTAHLCTICDIICSEKQSYEAHIQQESHIMNVMLLAKKELEQEMAKRTEHKNYSDHDDDDGRRESCRDTLSGRSRSARELYLSPDQRRFRNISPPRSRHLEQSHDLDWESEQRRRDVDRNRSRSRDRDRDRGRLQRSVSPRRDRRGGSQGRRTNSRSGQTNIVKSGASKSQQAKAKKKAQKEHITAAKAEKEKEQEVLSVLDEEAIKVSLYDIIKANPEIPAVGLEYITEIHGHNPLMEPKYMCKLCGMSLNSPKLCFGHIKGGGHRLTYLEKHHPHVYQKLSLFNVKQEQYVAMEIECMALEQEHGRGPVSVVRIENPADSSTSTFRFSAPVQIPAPEPGGKKGGQKSQTTTKKSATIKIPASEFCSEAQTFPLLGLEHVIEIRHPTDPELIRYRCKLCHCNFWNRDGIVMHVLGRNHRAAFFKENDSDTYYQYLALPITRDRNTFIDEKSREMAQNFEAKSVKVFIDKDAQAWKEMEKLREKKGGKNLKKLTFELKTKENTKEVAVKVGNMLEQANNPETKKQEVFNWVDENNKLQYRIMNQNIIRTQRASKFMSMFNQYLKSNPGIGLKWITEFQRPDPTILPWFICFLCKQKLEWKEILDHITSIDHRWNYIEKCFPTIHELLSNQMFRTVNAKQKKLSQYARDILTKEGLQSMEVMLELSVGMDQLKATMDKTGGKTTSTATVTTATTSTATSTDSSCSQSSQSTLTQPGTSRTSSQTAAARTVTTASTGTSNQANPIEVVGPRFGQQVRAGGPTGPRPACSPGIPQVSIPGAPPTNNTVFVGTRQMMHPCPPPLMSFPNNPNQIRQVRPPPPGHPLMPQQWRPPPPMPLRPQGQNPGQPGFQRMPNPQVPAMPGTANMGNMDILLEQQMNFMQNRGLDKQPYSQYQENWQTAPLMNSTNRQADSPGRDSMGSGRSKSPYDRQRHRSFSPGSPGGRHYRRSWSPNSPGHFGHHPRSISPDMYRRRSLSPGRRSPQWRPLRRSASPRGGQINRDRHRSHSRSISPYRLRRSRSRSFSPYRLQRARSRSFSPRRDYRSRSRSSSPRRWSRSPRRQNLCDKNFRSSRSPDRRRSHTRSISPGRRQYSPDRRNPRYERRFSRSISPVDICWEHPWQSASPVRRVVRMRSRSPDAPDFRLLNNNQAKSGSTGRRIVRLCSPETEKRYHERNRGLQPKDDDIQSPEKKLQRKVWRVPTPDWLKNLLPATDKDMESMADKGSTTQQPSNTSQRRDIGGPSLASFSIPPVQVKQNRSDEPQKRKQSNKSTSDRSNSSRKSNSERLSESSKINTDSSRDSTHTRSTKTRWQQNQATEEVSVSLSIGEPLPAAETNNNISMATEPENIQTITPIISGQRVHLPSQQSSKANPESSMSINVIISNSLAATTTQSKKKTPAKPQKGKNPNRCVNSSNITVVATTNKLQGKVAERTETKKAESSSISSSASETTDKVELTNQKKKAELANDSVSKTTEKAEIAYELANETTVKVIERTEEEKTMEGESDGEESGVSMYFDSDDDGFPMEFITLDEFENDDCLPENESNLDIQVNLEVDPEVDESPNENKNEKTASEKMTPGKKQEDSPTTEKTRSAETDNHSVKVTGHAERKNSIIQTVVAVDMIQETEPAKEEIKKPSASSLRTAESSQKKTVSDSKTKGKAGDRYESLKANKNAKSCQDTESKQSKKEELSSSEDTNINIIDKTTYEQTASRQTTPSASTQQSSRITRQSLKTSPENLENNAQKKTESKIPFLGIELVTDVGVVSSMPSKIVTTDTKNKIDSQLKVTTKSSTSDLTGPEVKSETQIKQKAAIGINVQATTSTSATGSVVTSETKAAPAGKPPLADQTWVPSQKTGAVKQIPKDIPCSETKKASVAAAKETPAVKPATHVPKKTPVAGQKTNVAGQKTPVAGQKTNVAGQKTPVAGQKTNVAGQKTPVAGQKTPVAGQKTDVAGQKTPVVEQKTTETGQKPSTAGQKPTVMGQKTTEPKTAAARQKTTEAGQKVTVAGQKPSVVGQKTIKPNTAVAKRKAAEMGQKTAVAGQKTAVAGQETDEPKTPVAGQKTPPAGQITPVATKKMAAVKQTTPVPEKTPVVGQKTTGPKTPAVTKKTPVIKQTTAATEPAESLTGNKTPAVTTKAPVHEQDASITSEKQTVNEPGTGKKTTDKTPVMGKKLEEKTTVTGRKTEEEQKKSVTALVQPSAEQKISSSGPKTAPATKTKISALEQKTIVSVHKHSTPVTIRDCSVVIQKVDIVQTRKRTPVISVTEMSKSVTESVNKQDRSVTQQAPVTPVADRKATQKVAAPGQQVIRSSDEKKTSPTTAKTPASVQKLENVLQKDATEQKKISASEKSPVQKLATDLPNADSVTAKETSSQKDGVSCSELSQNKQSSCSLTSGGDCEVTTCSPVSGGENVSSGTVIRTSKKTASVSQESSSTQKTSAVDSLAKNAVKIGEKTVQKSKNVQKRQKSVPTRGTTDSDSKTLLASTESRKTTSDAAKVPKTESASDQKTSPSSGQKQSAASEKTAGHKKSDKSDSALKAEQKTEDIKPSAKETSREHETGTNVQTLKTPYRIPKISSAGKQSKQSPFSTYHLTDQRGSSQDRKKESVDRSTVKETFVVDEKSSVNIKESRGKRHASDSLSESGYPKSGYTGSVSKLPRKMSDFEPDKSNPSIRKRASQSVHPVPSVSKKSRLDQQPHKDRAKSNRQGHCDMTRGLHGHRKFSRFEPESTSTPNACEINIRLESKERDGRSREQDRGKFQSTGRHGRRSPGVERQSYSHLDIRNHKSCSSREQSPHPRRHDDSEFGYVSRKLSPVPANRFEEDLEFGGAYHSPSPRDDPRDGTQSWERDYHLDQQPSSSRERDNWSLGPDERYVDDLHSTQREEFNQRDKDKFYRQDIDELDRQDRDKFDRWDRDDFDRHSRGEFNRQDRDEFDSQDRHEFDRHSSDEFGRQGIGEFDRQDRFQFDRQDRGEFNRQDRYEFDRHSRDEFERQDGVEFDRQDRYEFDRQSRDEFDRQSRDGFDRQSRDEFESQSRDEFDKQDRYEFDRKDWDEFDKQDHDVFDGQSRDFGRQEYEGFDRQDDGKFDRLGNDMRDHAQEEGRLSSDYSCQDDLSFPQDNRSEYSSSRFDDRGRDNEMSDRRDNRDRTQNTYRGSLRGNKKGSGGGGMRGDKRGDFHSRGRDRSGSAHFRQHKDRFPGQGGRGQIGGHGQSEGSFRGQGCGQRGHFQRDGHFQTEFKQQMAKRRQFVRNMLASTNTNKRHGRGGKQPACEVTISFN